MVLFLFGWPRWHEQFIRSAYHPPSARCCQVGFRCEVIGVLWPTANQHLNGVQRRVRAADDSAPPIRWCRMIDRNDATAARCLAAAVP
jgi:hypothetical protein